MIQTCVVRGELTVAYSRSRGTCYCRALEIDLLGSGRTKEEAFQQLQELVTEYVEEAVTLLAKGKKIAFYNPAEAKEWNRADQESYRLTLSLGSTSKKQLPKIVHPGKLGQLKGYVRSVGLVPSLV